MLSKLSSEPPHTEEYSKESEQSENNEEPFKEILSNRNGMNKMCSLVSRWSVTRISMASTEHPKKTETEEKPQLEENLIFFCCSSAA